MPEHQLALEPGFTVIHLPKLRFSKGYVYGSLYVIESVTNNVLILRSVYDRENGKLFILQCDPCDSGDEDFFLPSFCTVQLPVRVGLAIITRNAQK